MFKETEEGQTHSFNDNCGEPEHNGFVKCTGCLANYKPDNLGSHICDGLMKMLVSFNKNKNAKNIKKS